MIVDSLDNCALYENIHKDFNEVFKVLKEIAAGKLLKKVIIDEGNVWVNAPIVANIADAPKVFEAHKEFIDIHYVVSGAEMFGYAKEDHLETTKEYDEVDDYELLDGKQEFFTLKAGDFCIVFPQEAHIPAYQNVGTGELIRVVAKIRCQVKKE